MEKTRMTIEERALGGYPLPDEGHKDLFLEERHAYVAGASDQLKIDINKACKWIDNLMFAAGFDDYDRTVNIEEFKQVMKE